MILERKESLAKIIAELDENTRILMSPLLDDIFFIENQLDTLKKYPFLKVHPENMELQKPTAAAKQYKELLQQYINCLKLLCSVSGDTEGGEESPLRQYMKNKVKRYEKG